MMTYTTQSQPIIAGPSCVLLMDLLLDVFLEASNGNINTRVLWNIGDQINLPSLSILMKECVGLTNIDMASI